MRYLWHILTNFSLKLIDLLLLWGFVWVFLLIDISFRIKLFRFSQLIVQLFYLNNFKHCSLYISYKIWLTEFLNRPGHNWELHVSHTVPAAIIKRTSSARSLVTWAHWWESYFHLSGKHHGEYWLLNSLSLR